MKCCKCKYYKEMETRTRYMNECELTKEKDFDEYLYEDCPYITNSYNLKPNMIVKKIKNKLKLKR